MGSAIREAKLRRDDPRKQPFNWQDPAQLKACRRLVVVIADTLMRTALANLFRVHFGETDFVEASTLSNAVLCFQEAEDGWLIVHWPTERSADFDIIQNCSAVRKQRLVILCDGTAAIATRRGIEAGAFGVLSDRLSEAEFVSAMRSIFTGQRMVKFEGKRDRNAVDMERLANAIVSLNPRSRIILDLLCDGRSTPEIAAALGISLRTVKWHMTKLLSELNLTSRFRVVALVTRLKCSGLDAHGRLNRANA
jgi:DNA-binding NarL/FixJ family response regulator